MSRNKTKKFAANELRQNIVQPGKPLFEKIKGGWSSDFFGNKNPITLEVGCGRGEYTVGLGRLFPSRNFIGIDIKGDRIYKGSKIADEEGLKNVGFLRIIAHELPNFFEENEVSEIWVTFPDPRPKKRDIRRRLTNPRFFEMYRNILKPEGWFHLKTDNAALFEYSLEVVQEMKISNLEFTRDLYESPLNADHYGIETKYEIIWREKGSKMHYMRFQMD